MVSALPVWSNQGVEPPESLKTTGWQPGMKPSAQHMNWLFNRSYIALKELQENGGIADLQQQVDELETKVTAHLEEIMPHKFLDNGKWYRWGFRTVGGEPEFIYEEVL
ncbi:hypothetical protein FH508_0004155 [Lysinibacillus sp. CD3-6]|uniref:hypothetical protein n=1 Tax=Lysinibacillus sp. CD3-6 TaxID=2892541 RepID=UPI001124970A|nr:hypothetical protein [Lysinibacillus sp. CD3-6]UED81091.1 hypothetical protein FH508_0004155 [Lysinibacillus sp. CD3-6]